MNDSDFFQQIEELNQRGGRTLNVVDLIEAGTLDAPLAAFLWEKAAQGSSFLTAAGPGGAGKSTVLANLLNFLPAGTKIITTASEADLPRKPADGVCYLAHEIGSGPYFGYLWGDAASKFFDICRNGGCIASCLHADTPGELESILTGSPNNVDRAALLSIGFAAFIHVDRQDRQFGVSGTRRRVASVYESDGETFNLVWRWNADTDTYHPCGDAAAPPERLTVIEQLVNDGVRDFRQTRERIRKYEV